MAEYWEVIYKAIADFGDVLTEAAKAKAALEDVGKAAKDESATEVAGAAAAAQAHKRDTDAINEEKRALLELAAAAKLANIQSLYGGRSSMEQHLSDEQSELNLTTLLNRQKWLGFASPQQAYAYRQQEYNQRLLMNRAEWAGYTTPDQYLQYLVRYRTNLDNLNAIMRQRLGLFQETAVAASGLGRALGETSTQLDLGNQVGALQAFSSAVNAVPDTQITTVDVNDAAGIAELARWNAILRGIPDKKVTVLEVIQAAVGMGGVPVRPTYPIYPRPAPDIAPRPVLGLGGGAGGGGGGPPPRVAAGAPPPEEPIPGGIAGVAAETAALKAESTAAQDTLAHLYQLMAAETDTGRIAQLGSAINALYSASIKKVGDSSKDAGDKTDAVIPKLKLVSKAADDSGVSLLGAAGGWWGLNRNITLFGGLFGGTALLGGIGAFSLALHTLIDFFIVAVPAIIAATAALGAFAVAAEPAALDVIAHVTGMHTAMDALGTGADVLNTDHLGPLTTQMGTLNATMKPMPVTIRSIQAAMAPTVVTLFGAAFSSLGKNMPIVQQIAQKTGTVIEDVVVRIQNALASPAGQKGLHDFITVATNDLKIFINIGQSIFKVATEFIQAGQITHVAETLFSALAYVLADVAKILNFLGPDVIAAGIAFFSFIHYVGPLVTILQSVSLGFVMLARNIPVVGDLLGKFAGNLGASNDQLIKMGQLTPQMRDMGKFFAAGDTAAIGMANSLKLTEDQLVKIVAQNPEIQRMAAAFGLSNEEAAAQAIAVTASGKSIEQYAIDTGKMNEELAASIAELEVEDRQMALLGVTAATSGAEAAAGIDAMAGATDVAAASTGLLEGAWASFTAFFAASGVGTIIIALAAIAAGALYIGTHFDKASKSVGDFVSGMQTDLQSLNASQAFQKIPQNIAAIGFQLDVIKMTSRNAVGNMAEGWSNFWKTLTSNTAGFARAKAMLGGLWEGITGGSSDPGNIKKLTAEQTQELKDWTTELQTAGATANKYGVTVTQSFALMDLAGVKAGDSFAVQTTKVNDLVNGWINMGVTGLNTADGMNRLGGAIDSVTLASEIQNSQITTLTGDFATFLSLVQGGFTTFETYATGINTINTNLKAQGASITGLNAPSLTLRQNWESNLTAGQKLYNALILQNAAAGNNAKTNAALAQSGKDVVNTLLEQGGRTTEVTNGAYALAQTMGYMGTNNYNALLKWSGGNKAVAGTTQDLNKQVGLLETGSANLQTDVQNLAAAINTNLNQAISQGIVNMPKMVLAASKVRDSVINARDQINKGVFAPPVISAGKAFEQALVAVYGTTPQGMSQAKTLFEAAYAELGVKKAQADKLWNSIVGGDTKPKAVKIPAPDTSAVEAKLRAMDRQLAPPPPNAWQHFIATAMAPPSVHNFLAFFAAIGGLFNTYVIQNWDKGWSTVHNGFINDIQHPLYNFFNKDIPGWFNDFVSFASGSWIKTWHQFDNDVLQPFLGFFTKWIPARFNDFVSFANGSWFRTWHDFDKNVLQPFDNFFTKWIPARFNDFVSFASGSWFKSWHAFDQQFLQPMQNLFTKTIPGWFDSFANWFQTKVAIPTGKMIIGIGNDIKTAFKDAVNWVINKPINSTINFINNDILKHLPGGLSIKTVNPIATGGSVPGTGDEDRTHLVAMGGEYMLRKPARMALEAQYGSNFLNTLNQADQWLGAGSRGNFASQGRPMAAGGLAHPAPWPMAAGGFVNPIGLNLSPGRVDMGVDYLGAGPLFALGSGSITSLYNSGWPGQHAFVGLHLDQTPPGGVPWWYYAEDINPFRIGVGSRVSAGQLIANATGAGLAPGIEVGYAAPPGTGSTMAAATGQIPKSGDAGARSSGWGMAADRLIASLGGRPGIVQGTPGTGTPGIKGGFSALWQSVEGLFSSAGNALGDLVKPLSKFFVGGAKELMGLAGKGADAIFDAIWDHSVKPLMQGVVPSDTAPGMLVLAAADQIRSVVDKFLTGQDASAKSTAAAGYPGVPPASGSALAAQNFAKAHLAQFGWGMDQWPPLLALWNQESGWNDNAVNPSSGAYGIPQSLGHGHPYNLGDYANQVMWGLEYIKNNPMYGTPAAAWAHERAHNWYAGGGTITDFRAKLAAAQSGERLKYFGLEHSFTIGPAKYRTPLTKQELDTLRRHQVDEESAYNRLSGAGMTKANLAHLGAMARAEQSTALDKMLNRLPGGHPGFASDLRHYLGLLSALSKETIPSLTVTPGPAPRPPTVLPGGIDPETAWEQYGLQTLPRQVRTEVDAFWKLAGAKLPKGVSNKDAAAWAAEMRILEAQQHKTIGLGLRPPGAYQVLQEDFVSPAAITPNLWTNFDKDLATLVSWQGGPGVPGGKDPPSSAKVKPRGEPGWKYLHNQWQTLRNALTNVQRTEWVAKLAWKELYGAGQTPGGLPGPGAPPGVTLPFNLAPLILGGPGSPVFDVSPYTGGYGFAGGGPVDVASMFAMGGPVYSQPLAGLSDSIARALGTGVSQVGAEHPRTLSEAASAIRGVGLNVESMTINNPVSEQPSQSITRASNRLAFLAGRGIA